MKIRHYLIKLSIERLPLDQYIFSFQSDRWKVEKEEKQHKFQMAESPSNSLCVVTSNWYIYHEMMKMITY